MGMGAWVCVCDILLEDVYIAGGMRAATIARAGE